MRGIGRAKGALLAVNRPTAPFVVRDGSHERVDLIAEWRIVDARWYEILAKAGLSKVFRVLMRLDPSEGEVRAVDEEWEVQWQAGVPSLSISKETGAAWNSFHRGGGAALRMAVPECRGSSFRGSGVG